MKAAHKLAVLAGLSALLSLSASAKTTEEAYLETVVKNDNVPVPVSVVSPRSVSPSYAGTKVEVAFTVDEKGTPKEFSVVSAPDALIASVIMDAVKKWRFNPAKVDGAAVAKKVVLPVRITEGVAFASN
ncbi:MAG: energy transducer TonB [Opitutus sp.]|nr:energy transducer TonB [Opitutus sp.]